MDRKELTIVEHLVEFRKRLLAVVICFFLVFCVSLLFVDQIYQYVTQSFQQKLIVLGPNDILWIYIRLASLMAFTITLPYTVYHICSFIKPGLKKEEARAVFAYIPASFLCFLVGLAFGNSFDGIYRTIWIVLRIHAWFAVKVNILAENLSIVT